MIDVEDLIALVHNYNPRTNAELIRAAYAYGARVHEGQMRHSGEPYFSHPVAVAAILTEQRLDDATIITALGIGAGASDECHGVCRACARVVESVRAARRWQLGCATVGSSHTLADDLVVPARLWRHFVVCGGRRAW